MNGFLIGHRYGVNSNDVPYLTRFPFHAAPHAGSSHSGIEGTNGRGKATN